MVSQPKIAINSWTDAPGLVWLSSAVDRLSACALPVSGACAQAPRGLSLRARIAVSESSSGHTRTRSPVPLVVPALLAVFGPQLVDLPTGELSPCIRTPPAAPHAAAFSSLADHRCNHLMPRTEQRS